MPPNVVEKYELEKPSYEGVDQVVELFSEGSGALSRGEEREKKEREGLAEKILRLAERQDL